MTPVRFIVGTLRGIAHIHQPDILAIYLMITSERINSVWQSWLLSHASTGGG